jgi:hypothetical protein
MPCSGSIAADVVKVLRARPSGASLAEIRDGVAKLRGEVLPHSVRGSVYAHLGDEGEKRFVRLGDGRKRYGRYELRG